MHLTSNEVTGSSAILSSAVAVVAIIAGYLGVRSANRNALAISREERSTRQQEELVALKRTTYVNFMSELNQLVSATITYDNCTKPGSQTSQEERDAAKDAQYECSVKAGKAVDELRLVSPSLYSQANEALLKTMDTKTGEAGKLGSVYSKLLDSMARDIHDK